MATRVLNAVGDGQFPTLPYKIVPYEIKVTVLAADVDVNNDAIVLDGPFPDGTHVDMSSVRFRVTDAVDTGSTVVGVLICTDLAGTTHEVFITGSGTAFRSTGNSIVSFADGFIDTPPWLDVGGFYFGFKFTTGAAGGADDGEIILGCSMAKVPQLEAS